MLLALVWIAVSLLNRVSSASLLCVSVSFWRVCACVCRRLFVFQTLRCITRCCRLFAVVLLVLSFCVAFFQRSPGRTRGAPLLLLLPFLLFSRFCSFPLSDLEIPPQTHTDTHRKSHRLIHSKKGLDTPTTATPRIDQHSLHTHTHGKIRHLAVLSVSSPFVCFFRRIPVWPSHHPLKTIPFGGRMLLAFPASKKAQQPQIFNPVTA